ncbi:hypothetical protein GCM10009792_02810 [Microcella alkalica]|uniref:Cache domain-containing protein n=1 Tax=Microcella alkalica TaxID=355930 RepID=A0A839EC51_9MICO|nr:cache domain-containing protein [Microcella alkalica]MBA8848022.1 hypothetical protein [Microcella alkalica]
MTSATASAPAERTSADPVALVTEYFGRAIHSLSSWTGELAGALHEAGGRGAVTTEVLDDLVEPYARRTFDSLDLPVYGAGFIAALDWLSDARSHLAWWQGADRAKLVLASQSVNKELIDYSELEWYRVPQSSGAPHVAGPYVDYLCSDEYTITVAAPVELDGQFVGVAGLDLLIDQVERDLLPRLSAFGSDVSIVNGVGRLLLSTSARRETGDSIRGSSLEGFERGACPGMALEVLTAR